MRVPQFSGYVESEVIRILDGGVSQSNAERSTLFEHLFHQKRFQDSVQLFTHRFQKDLKNTPRKIAYFFCIPVAA